MKKLSFLLLSLFITSISSLAQEVNINQDTITTPSGLKYIILKRGAGEKTAIGKEIGLHGIGTFFEGGKVFWETRESNKPFYFVMGTNSVIKGCEEGVSLMRLGDRYIFIMPPELAYGKKGKGIIPPNSTLVFDYEVISVETPKLSFVDILYEEIKQHGAEKGIALYNKLREEKPDLYCFREDQLNTLGYKFIKDKRYDEAIVVFLLNAKCFPNSFDVFDSLGEAYLLAEKNDLAITNYKKSLELYPKNTNAIEALKKLGVE